MPARVWQFGYAMRRFILVVAAVVFCALPLAAEEDSPLVAAAKKATRGKKKTTILITDETLKTMNKDSGHVTTTKIVYAPPKLLPQAIVPPGATVYKPETKKKAETPKPQPRDDAEGYLEGAEEGPPPPQQPPAKKP
jgi:hypothetical protein